MPELPDLQVFSLNLNKRFAGRRLQELTIVNKSKLKVPEKEFKTSLEGQKLEKVYREGKELRFQFANGNILGLHLMLNGNLYLFERTNEHKNTIIELLFQEDKGLAMADWQGMAKATLNPQEKTSPDALSDEVNYKFLKERLARSRTSIKNLLMDQKVIRGIGNAYADEILWDARIHPLSVCNKIPDEKIKELAKSIKSVLHDAEKQILKKKPDLISGEVRDFLFIHNAKKKQSPTGGAIKKTEVNKRITYYTNEQQLFD
ncbi:MAG: Fpg/Nei family DNA glycosylase [Chitinophagaceae bacterium]|nr:Fpg/Nei family DNA glycosylase [Chitinophagaceae bacterium]